VKDRADAILRPAQAAYLERLLPPRDGLRCEMEAASESESIPSSDPEVGRLLEILARSLAAQRMLEVGTAIGYGALAMLRGSAQGRLTTIDPDGERLERARGYLQRAGVADRAELVAGRALDILPRLQGPFDLVYIDAVKTEYRRYLDLSLPLVRVGGLLVVDNLLWKGRVAEPPEEEEDAETRAIAAFNGYFMIHPQLVSVILPLGDGVGLATKTRPLVTEMGGPF
jgi:predicted O-methyltransferase YrrM